MMELKPINPDYERDFPGAKYFVESWFIDNIGAIPFPVNDFRFMYEGIDYLFIARLLPVGCGVFVAAPYAGVKEGE